MMKPTFHTLRTAVGVLALASLGACQSVPGAAAQVTRYPNPGPAAVSSKAVEIAAATPLVFVSGNTPLPQDPAAPEFSAAYWGDTEAQTASVFAKLQAGLGEMGLGMADVVKVQVFLVAPAQGQLADLAGFGRGYQRYFGAASGGRLPARTVVTVASLGRPGMLVEIEVTAARPLAHKPQARDAGRHSPP